MKIYTGYGDDGNTQLLGSQKTRKNDVRIAVCGTLDELNALLGVVVSRQLPKVLRLQIMAIQGDLFVIGSMVASVGADSKMELPSIELADSQRLESEIDVMNAELTPLTNFLLPGGADAAATMHLARAVCRRAERLIADLVDQFPEFDSSGVFKYMNRLSDWCFIAARFINHVEDIAEPIWDNRKS